MKNSKVSGCSNRDQIRVSLHTLMNNHDSNVTGKCEHAVSGIMSVISKLVS